MEYLKENYLALSALIISIVNLIFNRWDRSPRLQVSANLETLTEYVSAENFVGLAKGETVLWITISNHSARRIFITTIDAQWSWYLLLPFQWKKIRLEDLQRDENKKSEPITKFWIEPWENVVLSANGDEFEHELNKHFSSSHDNLLHLMLNYRIIVYDGQRKKYRSNKIRIINRSVMYKNFLQISKMYFNRTKA